MFTNIRSLFAKPVTVESVRAELGRVAAKREKVRAKSSRSPFVGGLIFDPMTKVLKIRRREEQIRLQLAELERKS